MRCFATVLLLTELLRAAVSDCPLGAVQGVSSSTCYYYKLKPRLWFEAQEECRRLDATLVSVHSSLINSFLVNVIDGECFDGYWLGATTVFDGRWAWVDGSRFDYTNWAANQPAQNGSFCLSVQSQTNEWYSRSCDTARPYVCKTSGFAGQQTPIATTKASTTMFVTTATAKSSTASSMSMPTTRLPPPTTTSTSTTTRRPRTTAPFRKTTRRLHPRCEKKFLITVDSTGENWEGSVSLSAQEYQKQKNFLRNVLFLEEQANLQRLGLASFIGCSNVFCTNHSLRNLVDFGSIQSLADIQRYLDGLKENSLDSMNPSRLFSEIANNTCGGPCYLTAQSFSTVSFALSTLWPPFQAGTWAQFWWQYTGYYANYVKQFGRLTMVVRKGAVNVDLMKKYITNYTIEWDLSKDEPDDWQTNFYRAFGCEINRQ